MYSFIKETVKYFINGLLYIVYVKGYYQVFIKCFLIISHLCGPIKYFINNFLYMVYLKYYYQWFIKQLLNQFFINNLLKEYNLYNWL